MCADGYFDSDIGDVVVCAQCDQGCLTCNDATASDCLSCSPDAHLDGGACECDDGFYNSDLGAGVACSACDESCITCEDGTKTDCLSCGDFQHLDGGACVCDGGYYDADTSAGVACTLCHDSCVTCAWGSTMNCVSCGDFQHLDGGACVCDLGYHDADAGAAVVCADDDECALDTDGCDPDPDACVNFDGGYECLCPIGWVGTGDGPDTCVSATVDNPMLHFRFDGNANNDGVLGSSFDGSTVDVTWVAGVDGDAVKFTSATDSAVSIPETAEVMSDYPVYTVAFWLREDSSEPNERTVHSNDADGEGCSAFYHPATGGDDWHGCCAGSSGGEQCWTPQDWTDYDIGQWHHLILRYEGTSTDPGGGGPIDVYLDGNPVATIANSESHVLFGVGQATDLTIGAGTDAYVDDYRVYNNVFDEATQCEALVGRVWDGGSCVVDCGPPTPPINGVVATPDGTAEGDVATHSCNPGLALSGTATQTCQSDGLWNGTVPTCVFDSDTNYVFVTTTPHNGNLGGLTGADAICQAQAEGVSLPGTYQAFLHVYETEAQTRFSGSSGWYRVDGLAFANDLDAATTGAVLYPPILDPNGDVVYAETWAGDDYYEDNCASWTSDADTAYARYGRLDSADRWDGTGFPTCDEERRLLCLRHNGLANEATASAPGTRLAFVSSVTFYGSGQITSTGPSGRDNMDLTCQSDFEGVFGTDTGRVFRAFVSGTSSAASRIGDKTSSTWARHDGVVIAETPGDLFDWDLIAPLNLRLDGTYLQYGVVTNVWTGSANPNSTSINDCSNWTSRSPSAHGWWRYLTETGYISGDDWDDFGFRSNGACDDKRYVYCIED